MHASPFGVCYEVRSFVLQLAEELDGIPDEQLLMTVSFYSYTTAPVDVVGILNERPTETAGRAPITFSYSRQRNF